jgi:hypothetical protein
MTEHEQYKNHQEEPSNNLIEMPEWPTPEVNDTGPEFEFVDDAPDRFAAGSGVIVRRSDGTLESGWKTTDDENEHGILVVSSDNTLEKRVPRDKLAESLDEYVQRLTRYVGTKSMQATVEQPVDE